MNDERFNENRFRSYEKLNPGWRIGAMIGKGTNSYVYELSQSDGTEEPNQWALKIIPLINLDIQNMSDREIILADQRQRIYNEISVLKRLDGLSNNIMSFHGSKTYAVFDSSGQNIVGYDVLLILGRLDSLPRAMYYGKITLTESNIYDIAVDMASALRVCHGCNILHRDIKPDNIFLKKLYSEDRYIYKLGDFGESVILKDPRHPTDPVGSKFYIAPEIRRGEEYTVAADIYSLGIVLYQLLNGNCCPFMERVYDQRGEEMAQEKLLDGHPKNPPRFATTQSFTDIVMKCCEHDQNMRFHSSDELYKALINLQTYVLSNDAIPIAQKPRASTIDPHFDPVDTSSAGHTRRIRAQESGAYEYDIFRKAAMNNAAAASSHLSADSININGYSDCEMFTSPYPADPYVETQNTGTRRLTQNSAEYDSLHAYAPNDSAPLSYPSDPYVESQNTGTRRLMQNSAAYDSLHAYAPNDSAPHSYPADPYVESQVTETRRLGEDINSPDSYKLFENCRNVEVKENGVITADVTYNDGEYSGTMVNGMREGNGTFVYYNGDEYSGEWHNDIRHGKGIFTWKIGDRKKYVGSYFNGSITGYGVLLWSNGDEYNGEFENNLRSGKGVMKWSNNDIYDGYFKDDLKHGLGTMRHSDGSVYEGSFVDDVKCCVNGKMTWENGDEYIGEFSNDRINGKGVMTYGNGDVYTGNFHDGVYEGSGVLIYASDNEYERYEGSFSQGEREGFGILTYRNGDVFKGCFVDGLPNDSDGEFIFSSGDSYKGIVSAGVIENAGVYSSKDFTYTGGFKEGRKEGRGEIVYADGSVFSGSFVNDMRCGVGTWKFKNKTVFIGDFVDDNICGQGKITYPDGTVYEGEFACGEITGFGKMTLPDNTEFVGHFEKGKLCGEGRIVYSDGSVLSGEFSDGQKISGTIYEYTDTKGFTKKVKSK